MMFGMFPPCSVPGLIPFGAFRGAEEKVSPSEVAGRQDPLASAPFLAERRRTLVSGAHGEDQQPPADDDTEAAQHRLSGDVDDVRDAGARGEIGRASCRERVEIAGGAVPVKEKT